MNKFLYRQQARFYLGESEEQAQYVFSFRDDAPKGLQRSFVIALDKDNMFSGSAIEVARDLQDIIDSYWINSDKSKIKAVVDYLEKWADIDEYDGLIAEKEKIEKRLGEINNELGGYDPDDMAKWTAELTAELEESK